jgi:general stress protein 26
MSEERSLRGAQAINKMKELAGKMPICMFLTRLNTRPIPARPMSTQEVDDRGTVWFLSSRSSHKDQDIQKDPLVQLVYCNMDNSEFMSLLGDAEEYDDPILKNRLWTPIAKTWFPKGVEDPDLVVIAVRPTEGYYWDTKSGKVVSLLKIVASSIIGSGNDDGVEGRLKP